MLQLHSQTTLTYHSNGLAKLTQGTHSLELQLKTRKELDWLSTLTHPQSRYQVDQTAASHQIPLTRSAQILDKLREKQLLTEFTPLLGSSPADFNIQNPAQRIRQQLTVRLELQTTHDPAVFQQLLAFTQLTTSLLLTNGFGRVEANYPGHFPPEIVPAEIAMLLRAGKGKTPPPDITIRVFPPAAEPVAQAVDSADSQGRQGIPQVVVIFHPMHLQVGPVVNPADAFCLRCLQYLMEDLNKQSTPVNDYPVLPRTQLMAGVSMLVQSVCDIFTPQRLQPGEMRFLDAALLSECVQWGSHPLCTHLLNQA